VTLAAELRAVSAVLEVRNEASNAAAPPIRRARPKRSHARRIVLAVAIVVTTLAIALRYLFRSV
jgi:hypothetical protein